MLKIFGAPVRNFAAQATGHPEFVHPTLRLKNLLLSLINTTSSTAGPSGRAVYGVGLRPLAC
jgi:hypothetical protein